LSAITAYPQPGKGKALDVCRAFAAGCGGRVVEQIPPALLPGTAVFYGVRPAWAHLWAEATVEGRPWVYIDNGFFPCGGRYFRAAQNKLQAPSGAPGQISQLGPMGVTIRPWRVDGGHILVCLQSEEFMQTVAQTSRDIVGEVLASTDRPVKVRRKGSGAPLAADLVGCHCVVTWSSNAAIEAICAGVPAIVLGESAAAPMASNRLEDIKHPPRPEGREQWAADLLASQWTLEEMRSGKCWEALCRSKS
jgi:hypothetical protein